MYADAEPAPVPVTCPRNCAGSAEPAETSTCWQRRLCNLPQTTPCSPSRAGSSCPRRQLEQTPLGTGGVEQGSPWAPSSCRFSGAVLAVCAQTRDPWDQRKPKPFCALQVSLEVRGERALRPSPGFGLPGSWLGGSPRQAGSVQSQGRLISWRRSRAWSHGGAARLLRSLLAQLVPCCRGRGQAGRLGPSEGHQPPPRRARHVGIPAASWATELSLRCGAGTPHPGWVQGTCGPPSAGAGCA